MLRRFILLLTLFACFCALRAPSVAAQVAVAPSPEPMLQFSDANGVPLAGGCVFSYAAGTSTPLTTYAESTGTTPNTNPVVLDSAGRATIFLTGAAYKLELRAAGGLNCASGTVQWTIDGITAFVPGEVVKDLIFDNGASRQITFESGGAAARQLSITGHNNSGVGTGGVVAITGGVGASTGGKVSIRGASGSSGGGNAEVFAGDASGGGFGGRITMVGGNSSSGGGLSLFGGNAPSGGDQGGGVTAIAGNSGSNDPGGPIVFTAGIGGAGGAGGPVTFTAGAGGTGNTAGGPVTFTAGAGVGTGDGGDVTFTAGAAPGVGDGGDINFVPGTSASGTPGRVKLNGAALGTKQIWRAGLVEAAPTVTEIATALPAPVQCTVGQTVDRVSVVFISKGTGTLTFNVIRYNSAGVSQGNIFGSTQTYDNTGNNRQDYTVTTTTVAATDYFRFNILTVNSQTGGTLTVEGRCNTVD